MEADAPRSIWSEQAYYQKDIRCTVHPTRTRIDNSVGSFEISPNKRLIERIAFAVDKSYESYHICKVVFMLVDLSPRHLQVW